jgi:hypothetical protein
MPSVGAGHEKANDCEHSPESAATVNLVTTEIGQLEKTLNALVHRPRLILRDYWISKIECLLGLPDLSPQERQRLRSLLDSLGSP